MALIIPGLDHKGHLNGMEKEQDTHDENLHEHLHEHLQQHEQQQQLDYDVQSPTIIL